VTKHRPSWSDVYRLIAVLGLGLWLPGAALAADLSSQASHRLLDRKGLGEGLASYYGGKFNGRKTASGEVFDKTQFTAASNRFPLGSMLAVRRPANGLCAIVRVNDRMHRRHKLRIVDVSKSAAISLDLVHIGVSRVQVVPLGPDWREQGAQACAEAFAAVGESCLMCSGVPEPAVPEATSDAPADNQEETLTLPSEKGIVPP
jgi:rare lipoprotein A (peptidoglycan hydrolase)